MLLARVVEEKERKIECYERVIKINPNNTEAKIGLFRIQYPDKTIPKRRIMEGNPWQASKPINKNILRGVIVTSIILLGLGTTTFAIARNNPESNVAMSHSPVTPLQTIADDVARNTCDVGEISSALVDTDTLRNK
jgi:hypothetical protein